MKLVECAACGSKDLVAEKSGVVVCAYCQTKYLMTDVERLDDDYSTGLPTGSTHVVTDGDFVELVVGSRKPILVLFWADWSGPCREVLPRLDAIAATTVKLVVAKINTDENPETCRAYGVQTIPAMVVFRGGQIVKEIYGSVPMSKLQADLATLL